MLKAAVRVSDTQRWFPVPPLSLPSLLQLQLQTLPAAGCGPAGEPRPQATTNPCASLHSPQPPGPGRLGTAGAPARPEKRPVHHPRPVTALPTLLPLRSPSPGAGAQPQAPAALYAKRLQSSARPLRHNGRPRRARARTAHPPPPFPARLPEGILRPSAVGSRDIPLVTQDGGAHVAARVLSGEVEVRPRPLPVPGLPAAFRGKGKDPGIHEEGGGPAPAADRTAAEAEAASRPGLGMAQLRAAAAMADRPPPRAGAGGNRRRVGAAVGSAVWRGGRPGAGPEAGGPAGGGRGAQRRGALGVAGAAPQPGPARGSRRWASAAARLPALLAGRGGAGRGWTPRARGKRRRRPWRGVRLGGGRGARR